MALVLPRKPAFKVFADDPVTEALDVSNFYGPLSPSWVARLPDLGIGRATPRLSLERQAMVDIARQQIQHFRDGGVACDDGYVWGYPRADDPDALAQRVLDAYGDLSLEWYWLDMEDEDGWSYDDPARNADWLRRALAGFDALDLQVGIYTGLWWWVKPNRMANSQEFSGRPLWVSFFDRVPGLGGWRQFGGWTECYGKQWCGESSGPEAVLAGVAVDRSTWNLAKLGSGMADDQLQKQYDELKKKYEDLDSWCSSAIHDTMEPALTMLDRATIDRGQAGWTKVRKAIDLFGTNLDVHPRSGG